MRFRQAPITAGTALLALSLLAVPASAASGSVTIYDQSRRVQTISSPAAGRCYRVAQVRVPRVVNQTGARIELHRTRNCGQRPAGTVGPRSSGGVAGLRAIKARG